MKTLEKGLRKMRVLTAYKKNYRRDRKGAYYHIGIALTNDLSSGRNQLGGAFAWLDTPEGHEFWSYIDYKLNNYFENV